MNISEQYIKFLSDKRTATFSVMVSAIIGAVLASIDNRLSSGMTNMMSVQLTFSADVFRSLISPLSENAVSLLVRYLRLDIVFSFCYAVTLSSITAAMWGHLNELLHKNGKTPAKAAYTVFRLGMTLPYLAAIANIAENVMLYAAVRRDLAVPAIITPASFFAASKYMLLALSISAIAYMLVSRRKIIHGKPLDIS